MFVGMFNVEGTCFAGNHMAANDVAFNPVSMLLAHRLWIFGHKL